MLWKAARPEDEAVGAAWDAPFGRGRPGWHIECSAMALELIRRKWGVDVLDIHAGAVDLIFPHHEDEIAQSCAFTGKEEFARVWVHGEFLDLAGTKMSKRYGNILTARDLREQGADPGAVRHLLFNTHYRQKLDWSDAALGAASEGSARLGAFRDRLELAAGRTDDPEAAAAADRFRAGVRRGLDDDLNAPEALGGAARPGAGGNRLLDEGRRLGPAFQAAWALADDVLAVAPVRSGPDRCGRRPDCGGGGRHPGAPAGGGPARTGRTPRLGRCAGPRSVPPRSGGGTSRRPTGSGTCFERPAGRSGTAGMGRSR